MRHANQLPNFPDAGGAEFTPAELVRQINTIFRTRLTLSANAAAKYGVKTNSVLAEIFRRLKSEGRLPSGKEKK